MCTEAHHARLRHLAESIDNTARKAQLALSLMFIMAFYLAFIIYSSTDENFLFSPSIEWPQVDVKFPIAESYFVAPIIFLYLHAQLLLALSVLARKRRRFDSFAARGSLPRGEYGDWLSAFSAVQSTMSVFGAQHVSARVLARMLKWIGVEAAPLLLLVFFDMSFVRYQSSSITWSHHFIVCTDLVLVACFNWRIFERRTWVWPSWSATIVEWWRAFIIVLCFFLVVYGHAPRFDLETMASYRFSMWRSDYEQLLEEEKRDEMDTFHIVLFSEENAKEADIGRGSLNPFDAVVCRLWDWDIGCRYLHVGRDSDEPFGIQGMDLSGRSLRYVRILPARFEDVELRDAELSGADLEGAVLLGNVDFTGAQLRGANLSEIRNGVPDDNRTWEGEKTSGEVIFERAQLAEADFSGAWLRGADFRLSKAREAIFRKAELQRAIFVGAGLQGANLRMAQLQEADLFGARLGGADLRGANLREAYLRGADLRRADLRGAQLRGADFTGSQLEKVHLGGAQLQGAILEGARLQCPNIDDAPICGGDALGAELQCAGLFGARLEDADLRWMDLRWADLREADLMAADLRGADLRGAQLRNADLRGAWLQEVHLGGAQLQGAILGGARLQCPSVDDAQICGGGADCGAR